jgi:signal transduction histidine kinase/DNA-binding response OmpR family regulator
MNRRTKRISTLIVGLSAAAVTLAKSADWLDFVSAALQQFEGRYTEIIFIGALTLALLVSVGLFAHLMQRQYAKSLAQGIETATKAKSEFLANMSHEIRTPLTSIIGYVESVLADNLDLAQRKAALGIVLRNSRHLLSVINTILDLSKIEAGKLEIEYSQISVPNILSDVTEIMQLKAQQKGVSFSFQYTYPIPAFIHSDETRLKQILINLLGNALKFTEKGAVKVLVSFDTEMAQMSFAVIDSGIGMTEEQQNRLFQSFAQGDSTTTRKYGGTGLGLVISNHLAELLGGSITLQSSPGRGSIFTVMIATGAVEEKDLLYSPPLVQTEMSAVSAPPSARSLKGRVLIAEDGEDNQAYISYLLKQVGIDFKLVVNGFEAVKEALAGNFDLILMDMQMPILDGYTATKSLREKGYTKPIIGLSANAMRSDIERSLSAGCSDFIGKPFTREDFFNKINHALRAVQQSQTQQSQANTAKLAEAAPDFHILVAQFVGQLATRVTKIEAAFSEKNWSELEMYAHRLKGAAANFGYLNISEVTGNLENAAKDQAPALAKELISTLRIGVNEAEMRNKRE